MKNESKDLQKLLLLLRSRFTEEKAALSHAVKSGEFNHRFDEEVQKGLRAGEIELHIIEDGTSEDFNEDSVVEVADITLEGYSVYLPIDAFTMKEKEALQAWVNGTNVPETPYHIRWLPIGGFLFTLPCHVAIVAKTVQRRYNMKNESKDLQEYVDLYSSAVKSNSPNTAAVALVLLKRYADNILHTDFADIYGKLSAGEVLESAIEENFNILDKVIDG